MKRPPALIIINLVILSAGYLGYVYVATGGMLDEIRRGRTAIPDLFQLLLLTLCMIGTYAAVLSRHSRSILLLGAILLLSASGCRPCWGGFTALIIILLLNFIMGISFIVWSISLDENSNQPENASTHLLNIYKYWRYSILASFAVAILCGMLGSYFGDISRNNESIQKTMYQIMNCFIFAGILQLVIYYILCKIGEHKERQMNSTEKN